MPATVWGAYDTFRKNEVDLDADQTKTARSSRDFLFNQLNGLNSSILGFPPMSGGYLNFGSFARHTKIRPINDIDIMILLSGSNTTAIQSPNDPYCYWLRIDDAAAPLTVFHDEYGYVNSTKILNKIKTSLPTISQYSKAEIKKTMQAVTLNLKSYPWIFDIVPAVPISSSYGTASDYYLIPDGKGEWIRTDPRRDGSNVSAVSRKHGGYFLPVMRLLKYWNNRTNNKSRLSSYYFETLVLKTLENASEIKSYSAGVRYFFDYGQTFVTLPCPDPKGLGSSLDLHVDWETKQKIIEAMKLASTYAGYADMYEASNDPKNAIYWWQQVFGPGFPSYG